LKFFFDHCVCKRFPQALRAFDIDAEHLLERYPSGDPGDKVWIPEVCKAGFIIITADSAQVKTRGKTIVECRLYQAHKGIAFFFPRGFPQMPLWPQTAAFFRAWVNIADGAANAKPRDLFDVSSTGSVAKKHIRKVN
jgi:hypothetical protein